MAEPDENRPDDEEPPDDDVPPDLARAQEAFEAYVASGGSDASDLPWITETVEEALRRLPAGHPDRLAVAATLFSCLRIRFLADGDPVRLDEAVECGLREFADAGPDARPPLAFHSNLASVLQYRFQRTGHRADLDTALRHLHAAEIRAADEATVTQRTSLRGNLVLLLLTRDESTDDLAEAVRLARRAYEQTPAELRAKTAYLLSLALATRYERHDVSTDLADAHRLAVEAVTEATEDHPEFGGFLAHLARLETSRYQRTGDQTARRRAAAHYEHVMRILDRVEAIRPVVLANWTLMLEAATGVTRLGEWLTPRTTDTDHQHEVALAVRLLPGLEAAVKDAEGTVQHPLTLAALARAHLALYSMRGTDDDLASAIGFADAARDPMLAAATMLARWDRDRRRDDLDRAGDFLADLARRQVATPVEQIRAAHALAMVRMTADDPVSALDASRVAVDLLPRLAWPGTSRADQELRLAEAADVSHDAAAAALAAGDRSAAARSAEAGRGVLWAGLLNARHDLAALRAVAPDLAGRLMRVREELFRPWPAGPA